MMNLKIASVAGFVLAVLSIVALMYRDGILAHGIAGIMVQIGAVLLMIWARMTLGMRSFHAAADPTAGVLITSGPYRFLRHPIYAAIIYFIWAAVFTNLDLINTVLGIAVTAGLFVRMLSEEHLLRDNYPGYIDYSFKTKRLIPFVI